MSKVLLSTIVSTVILFLWNGLAQMFPWGIPSTQNVNVQTEVSAEQEAMVNFQKLPPNSLTTGAFDEQFVGKISTLSTDETFSWIVTQPLPDGYGHYFMKEAITQLLVGLLIAILLSLTLKLELKIRLTLVTISAIAASIATYGQLMNWWVMPAMYAVGVSINLIVSWIIVAYISARFILKK